MRTRSRRLATASLALAAALVSTTAFASPFLLTDGTVGLVTGDLTGYIAYTGNPALGPEHVYIGPLNMTVTDQATNSAIQQTVFCTDIFDYYQGGRLYNLQTAAFPVAKQHQIIALLENVTPASAAEGAAVQAAVWEIINEPGNSYDVTQGLLTVSVDSDQAAFAADVSTYLANVTNGTWHASPNFSLQQYVPADGANQSFGFLQLTGHSPTIPEPATLSVLGLGALALAATRRRAS
jgi:hypothetical protein